MILADDVKAAINTEQFYQSRLPNLKSGYGWVEGGLCPFHADKNAGSFRVNLDTGAYKCYSCDAKGGDVISFAMQQDGTDFPTTIKTLAAEYGVERVKATPEQHLEIQKRKRQARHNDLDDGIYHECHILMQTTAGRKNNRDLENDCKFREDRPDWQPYPKEVWDREVLAAQRLTKMLEARYDV